MRVFMAIDFEPCIKQKLWELSRQFQTEGVKANYTKRDNLHLTLKFFGEIQAAALEDIRRVCKNAVSDMQPFHLQFDRLGTFGRTDESILWMGVKVDESLLALYENLEECFESIGFERETRHFRPHVTLARRMKTDPSTIRRIKTWESEWPDVYVTELVLMQSTRDSKGLVYVPLERFAF